MYPQTIQQQKMKRRIIALGILLVLLIIGLVVNSFIQQRQFRVLKTDPDLSAVATATPYITVYTNRDLSTSSLRYADPNHIVKSTAIAGKIVTFTLEPNLQYNGEYSVTITSLSSTTNEVLHNYQLKFIAKNIAFSSLPKAQQQASIAGQDEQLYEPDNIDYQNFQTLSNDYGLTNEQLGNVEKLLFDYSNIIKKQFRVMILDPNSTTSTTHDPNGDSTIDSVDFNVKLADQTYRAHAEYDAIYDAVHLVLSDSAGAQIYDSANSSD